MQTPADNGLNLINCQTIVSPHSIKGDSILDRAPRVFENFLNRYVLLRIYSNWNFWLNEISETYFKEHLRIVSSENGEEIIQNRGSI